MKIVILITHILFMLILNNARLTGNTNIILQAGFVWLGTLLFFIAINIIKTL